MATRNSLLNLSRRALNYTTQLEKWQNFLYLRSLTTEASNEEEEFDGASRVVAEAFLEENKKLENFIESTKDYPIPLAGSDEEIREYHIKITELKEKHGIPDSCEKLHKIMKLKMSQSNNNVRTWVHSLKEPLGDELYELYMDAVTETEKETGEILEFDKDNKGIPIFQEKLDVIMEKYGVKPDITKSELLFEEEKSIIKEAVQTMKDKVEEVKERLGAEDEIDVTTVKMTYASKNF